MTCYVSSGTLNSVHSPTHPDGPATEKARRRYTFANGDAEVGYQESSTEDLRCCREATSETRQSVTAAIQYYNATNT